MAGVAIVSTRRTASDRLFALQLLRAVAAIGVVISHVRYDFLHHFGLPDALPGFLNAGAAGVDLFFVISGFVMVYSSETLFGRDRASAIFLVRRVARIVPLYWLMSVAMIAYVATRGFAASDTSPAHAALSFLFIPYPRPSGEMSPVYGVGWTLNYEMFFYSVFALCLGARRGVTVARVAAILAVLAIAGALLPGLPVTLAYWVDPVVLEFAIGMLLALAYRSGVRLPVWVAAPIMIGGLVLVVANSGAWNAWLPRWLGFGMPAAMEVAALALAKRDIAIGWIDRIGDASYALYLCHPIVIAVGRMASLKGYLNPAAMPWVYLCVIVAASTVVALLLHRLVEVPLTGRARRLLAALATPRERVGAPIS
jgi:exopolysaccharide production protein ExoZ